METDVLELLGQLGSDFTFGKRPISIPHDLRADYRMAVLMLMIGYCGYKGQAPLPKLHVLNWALRTSTSRRAFIDRLDGKLHMRDVPVKFDPAFSRAIDLARGDHLVERTPTMAIVLTPTGSAWLDDIRKEPSCFATEKAFLEAVGKRLTNDVLKSILTPSSVW